MNDARLGTLPATARRWLLGLTLSALLAPLPAAADPLISFEDDASVPRVLIFGSLLVGAGSVLDVARGLLALDETTVFGASAEDLDAVHRRSDGMFIISTVTSSVVDGTLYTSADLILVDPATGEGSLFFDGSAFDPPTNVNAFFLFEEGPNAGKLLLSTSSITTIAEVEFGPGDLILYDPTPGMETASPFFDESLTDGTAAQKTIDAVHVFRTGLLVLSFLRSGGTLGELTLNAEDLIAYDPASGNTSVLLAGGGLFNGITANLDAVTYESVVLAPDLGASARVTAALALALLGLRRARRRR